MPYNLGEFTLQEELDTQKQFAKASGFKDQALAPLQKAVTSLARVGSQLSSGDTNGASATLRCAAHLPGTCQGFPVVHSHLPHLRTCSEAFVTLVVGLPPLAKHVECRKVLEHVQPCNCGAHTKAKRASLVAKHYSQQVYTNITSISRCNKIQVVSKGPAGKHRVVIKCHHRRLLRSCMPR